MGWEPEGILVLPLQLKGTLVITYTARQCWDPPVDSATLNLDPAKPNALQGMDGPQDCRSSLPALFHGYMQDSEKCPRLLTSAPPHLPRGYSPGVRVMPLPVLALLVQS